MVLAGLFVEPDGTYTLLVGSPLVPLGKKPPEVATLGVG